MPIRSSINPDGSTELEVLGADRAQTWSDAAEEAGLLASTPREFIERPTPWLGPTTGPRTERLVVSVSTEELEQIEARARADGRTRSDWVRRTLLGDVQPGRAPSRG